MLFVWFPGGVVVTRVRRPASCLGPHATPEPSPSSVGHRRESSPTGRDPGLRLVVPLSGRPGQPTSDAPALPSGAADAAESAADVLVDEAERRGHDETEISDGKQCQRNTENRVEYRYRLTPAGLWCNVPVSYNE